MLSEDARTTRETIARLAAERELPVIGFLLFMRLAGGQAGNPETVKTPEGMRRVTDASLWIYALCNRLNRPIVVISATYDDPNPEGWIFVPLDWTVERARDYVRAAIEVKGGYFGAQFRRIAKRRGQKRAAIAVAHSILTVIYHVLTRGVYYEDLGADFFDRRRPDQHARDHVRRLAEFGFTVTLEPIGAA